MSLKHQPSVQDIIDRLMQVKDKSQPFEIQMWDKDGFGLSYSGIEFIEYTNSDGDAFSVALDVKLTGKVTQTFGKPEPVEKQGRTIDYIGQQVTLSPYEDKHRPENQIQVEGIPINPTLRDDFDSTPNEDREELEISDWWGRPFIRLHTWADMSDSYNGYLARVSEIEDYTPKSREMFDHEQDERRAKWFESWPTGIRYDVRCLDGGAWDRSTSWAMVGDLKDAIAIAKSGKATL